MIGPQGVLTSEGTDILLIGPQFIAEEAAFRVKSQVSLWLPVLAMSHTHLDCNAHEVLSKVLVLTLTFSAESNLSLQVYLFLFYVYNVCLCVCTCARMCVCVCVNHVCARCLQRQKTVTDPTLELVARESCHVDAGN